MAKVLAFAQLHGFGFQRLFLDFIGERDGNTVFVDSDQRDRLRRRSIAKPCRNLGFWQTHANFADLRGFDEFTLAGTVAIPRFDLPFLAGFFVHGNDAPTMFRLLEYSKDYCRGTSDLADHTTLVGRVLFVCFGQAAKNFIANSKGRIALHRDDQDGWRVFFALPVGGFGEQVAVSVYGGDLQQLDVLQGACFADRVAGFL